VLIFGRKVIKSGLATQVNKKRKSIVIDNSWEICGKEEESVEHALIWCNHAVFLREAMRQYWALPDDEQLRDFIAASFLHRVDALDTDSAAQWLLLLWRTWQVRNNITHESEKLSFAGSVSFLRKYWCKADPHGKLPCLFSLVQGSLDGKGANQVDGTARGLVEDQC
jgi:hypothetical protein